MSQIILIPRDRPFIQFWSYYIYRTQSLMPLCAIVLLEVTLIWDRKQICQTASHNLYMTIMKNNTYSIPNKKTCFQTWWVWLMSRTLVFFHSFTEKSIILTTTVKLTFSYCSIFYRHIRYDVFTQVYF